MPPAFQGFIGGGASPNYINTQMPLTLYNGDAYEFTEAHSGYGYAQFATTQYDVPPQSTANYNAENIEIRLEEAMQIGEYYIVSFHTRFAPRAYGEGACHPASNELGLYLHTDSIFISEYTKADSSNSVEHAVILFQEDTVNANGFSVFLGYAVEPHLSLDTVLTDEMGWYLIRDTIYADKPYEYMYWGNSDPPMKFNGN